MDLITVRIGPMFSITIVQFATVNGSVCEAHKSSRESCANNVFVI